MNKSYVYDLAKQYLEAKDMVKKLKKERRQFAEFGGECTNGEVELCYVRFLDNQMTYDEYCPYCKKKTDFSIQIKKTSRIAVSSILKIRSIVISKQ